MQRAFTEKETRVFSQRAGASQFDDFIMTAVRNLAQNQNYYETKFFLIFTSTSVNHARAQETI